GAADEREKALAVINTNRAREDPPRGKIELQPIPVAYLGVWDTVLALGRRFASKSDSMAGGRGSFYTGDRPAPRVARAGQGLAGDEHRWDFRPEIWQGCLPTQKMKQRWFTGVQSNVGGGYGRDGLANIALGWIVEGAIEVFLKPYLDPKRPYGSLYNSS